MAIFDDAPFIRYEERFDGRTKERKEHDKIRQESSAMYDRLLNIFKVYNIPFTGKEIEDSTIFQWDGHTAVLKYWIDPFHRWKNYNKV